MISGCVTQHNFNNNNTSKVMNNNNNSKRPAIISSPVSILGCRSRRETASNNSISSASSSSSGSAGAGRAIRLAACNTSAPSSVMAPSLELKTCEFEATLQFADCDDDEDDDRPEKLESQPEQETAVVEADVNRVGGELSGDVLPSDQSNAELRVRELGSLDANC